MSGCGYVLQVGIAKTTQARILLKLLSGVFNLTETHTTRVVLIFSQSWSSHGLEVSATDDPRRAAIWQAISIKNSKRTGVWNLGPNSDLGMKFRT